MCGAAFPREILWCRIPIMLTSSLTVCFLHTLLLSSKIAYHFLARVAEDALRTRNQLEGFRCNNLLAATLLIIVYLCGAGEISFANNPVLGRQQLYLSY